MRIFFAFLALVTLFFTGCSSLTVNIPTAHVQSSEASGGENNFGYRIGTTNFTKYQITPDGGARPPNLSNPEVINNQLGFEGVGLYSISPRFDLEIFLGAVANGFNLKYQLLGSAANESKTGDYSFAFYNRVGFNNLYRSGNQNGALGPGGFPWRGETRSQFAELGLSLGKKISDEILLFAGLSANRLMLSCDIQQYPTVDGLNQGGQYTTGNLSGETISAALGLEFGRYTKKQIQVGATQLNLNNMKLSYGFANFIFQHSFAEEKLKPKISYELSPKDTWQGRDVGALALSYFVGFGTGQAVQDRWNEKGQYFLLADGFSFALLASTISSGDSNSSLGVALGIYAVSKVWQLIDVIVDANSSTQTKIKNSQ